MKSNTLSFLMVMPRRNTQSAQRTKRTSAVGSSETRTRFSDAVPYGVATPCAMGKKSPSNSVLTMFDGISRVVTPPRLANHLHWIADASRFSDNNVGRKTSLIRRGQQEPCAHLPAVARATRTKAFISPTPTSPFCAHRRRTSTPWSTIHSKPATSTSMGCACTSWTRVLVMLPSHCWFTACPRGVISIDT